MWIVILEDFDSHFGPFTTFQEAKDWALENYGDPHAEDREYDWRVVEILDPPGGLP